MAEFTPQEKLAYYQERKAYWEKKQKRFLAAKKIAHAKRRVTYYTGKIAAQEKIVAEQQA